MAYDDVRVFLEGAKDCYFKCADLRERVRKLDSTAQRMTANLNGMPRGGGADREALLAALADARGRLLLDIADEEARKIEIADFIDRVPTGAVGREILRRRYLHYESWKGVRRWMAAHGKSYSAQSVYRLHGEALASARVLWNQEHNLEN